MNGGRYLTSTTYKPRELLRRNRVWGGGVLAAPIHNLTITINNAKLFFLF